jgi:alpha-amylase
VHGEPQRTLFEDDGVLLLARGERGIVALNKTTDTRRLAIWTWGLRHGRWRCQLHGQELILGGERLELAVPPREAQLWLWQAP